MTMTTICYLGTFRVTGSDRRHAARAIRRERRRGTVHSAMLLPGGRVWLVADGRSGIV